MSSFIDSLYVALRQPFIWKALGAGVLCAGTCAYLGVFVIMRRIVFVSVGLAETAALGVAVGLLLRVPPEAAAFVLTVAAAFLFMTPAANGSRENLIGFLYCFCAALGTVLIAKNPAAEAHGINLISGNLLYVTTSELVTLSAVAAIVMLVQILFVKEFTFTAFDRETAAATGVRTGIWESLFFLSLAVVISISMKACGLVFVFGALVIPALTGLAEGRSLPRILTTSVVCAIASVVAGLLLSYAWDLPSAPAAVVLAALIYGAVLSAAGAVGKRRR